MYEKEWRIPGAFSGPRRFCYLSETGTSLAAYLSCLVRRERGREKRTEIRGSSSGRQFLEIASERERSPEGELGGEFLFFGSLEWTFVQGKGGRKVSM